MMLTNQIDYLTHEQNARRAAITLARKLYQGGHRDVFLNGGITQFDFPWSKVNGRRTQLYITYNILRRITATLTSLLLGKSPLLRSEDQVSLNDLVERTDLHRVFHDAIREASWAGECMVEVIRWDGQVYVQNLPPDSIYPIGERLPDGQYPAYRRYATAAGGGRHLLLETTYEPGRIIRQCFSLNGTAKVADMDLSLWPFKRPDGSDLPAEEPTGIDWNLIVWMGNEMDEGRPTSDYAGLIELQDELNAKQTQIARVLAKHSDPKLAAPAAMANVEGSLLSGQNVFFFNSKDELPIYITWNAELAHAFTDRDFTLDALCVQAEMAQVLLGVRRGATPDAARKLRLEATATLARVRRKSLHVLPFIRTVLETAQRLMGPRTLAAMSGYKASAELRDGLPTDELDEANVIATLTAGARVMSRRRAVERQIGQGPAVDAELAELEREDKARTPSIIMG